MINIKYTISAVVRNEDALVEKTSTLKSFLVENGMDLGKVIFLNGEIVFDYDMTFEELGCNGDEDNYLTVSTKQDGNLA